jgi:SAM-dependent methyltransferase
MGYIMVKDKASELLSFNQAKSLLPEMDVWVNLVIKRLSALLPFGRLRILEIGSAQGRGLIPIARLGHDAYGLEPWKPAIDIAFKLANKCAVDIRVVRASAENIPFEDCKFDLVLAFSVMEHVTNLDASLSEIMRVLKPGGIFWFNSTSSLCPIQGEIRGFPLFGWYPIIIKKYIMGWALTHRPQLIGYTKTPAMYWWTPYNARKRLRKAGFRQIWDRWNLRSDEEEIGLKRAFLSLAKTYPICRLLGDLLSSGCSYAAKKPL